MSPLMTRPDKTPSRMLQLLAWCVHLYTAMGLVAAAGMAVLIVRGGPQAMRGVFLLMIAAAVIDATDGTLARAVRIKEVLPGFDGRRLDDLTDFLTYAFLPLLLVWRAELLGPMDDWSAQAWLLAPLLASAYGFCQTDIKTEDGYFLGFPSYWNVVAFYLYVLEMPPWLALTVLMALAVLTFVPVRYLYPSQKGRLNLATTVLGAVWAVLLAWIAVRLPGATLPSGQNADDFTYRLAVVSLAFPVYYFAASWIVTFRIWRGHAA